MTAKLSLFWNCTFFLVADLISWVVSAISHILHIWATSWDASILLSYFGFVLSYVQRCSCCHQHVGQVQTDQLPGASSDYFLPPASTFSPCSMGRKTGTEKEGKHFVGEHRSCPLVEYQSLLVRARSAQKKQDCPFPPPHSMKAHLVIEGRGYKSLNSLSDTHYFVLVFPFHFWEIYAVVVWLRLQFLSFFILAFIEKKKKKIK